MWSENRLKNSENIQKKAIEDYKQTQSFREDACKEVAQSITKLTTLHFLNKYIKSSDIEKYRLQTFYEFVKDGDKEYKEKQKKTLDLLYYL